MIIRRFAPTGILFKPFFFANESKKNNILVDYLQISKLSGMFLALFSEKSKDPFFFFKNFLMVEKKVNFSSEDLDFFFKNFVVAFEKLLFKLNDVSVNNIYERRGFSLDLIDPRVAKLSYPRLFFQNHLAKDQNLGNHSSFLDKSRKSFWKILRFFWNSERDLMKKRESLSLFLKQFNISLKWKKYKRLSARYYNRRDKVMSPARKIYKSRQQIKNAYGFVSSNLFKKLRQKAFSKSKSVSFLKQTIKKTFPVFEKFFVFLELKLDTLLVRSNFVKNFFEARFFLSHSFIFVNGLKISSPVYICSTGDFITINFKIQFQVFLNILFFFFSFFNQLKHRFGRIIPPEGDFDRLFVPGKNLFELKNKMFIYKKKPFVKVRHKRFLELTAEKGRLNNDAEGLTFMKKKRQTQILIRKLRIKKKYSVAALVKKRARVHDQFIRRFFLRLFFWEQFLRYFFFEFCKQKTQKKNNFKTDLVLIKVVESILYFFQLTRFHHFFNVLPHLNVDSFLYQIHVASLPLLGKVSVGNAIFGFFSKRIAQRMISLWKF